MPRVFEVLCMDKLVELKGSVLKHNAKILEDLGEEMGISLQHFLEAMKKALNSDSVKTNTDSQKMLMTISNAKYVYDAIVPNLYQAIIYIFPYTEDTFVNFIDGCRGQLSTFIESLLLNYIGTKGDKYQRVIEQSITYTDESLGIEISLFYKNYIENSAELTELRTYVFKILANMVKVVNELRNYCPYYQTEILAKLKEEVIKIFRVCIHKYKNHFNENAIYQLWAEVEFLQSTISEQDLEGADKIYHNLKKIYYKITKQSKHGKGNALFTVNKEHAKSKFLEEMRKKTSFLFNSLAKS